MREIICTLSDLYGQDNTQSLTMWLNGEYLRESKSENETITLFDVGDDKVVQALKQLHEHVPMSAAQVIEHVSVLPAITHNNLDTSAIIRISHAFYHYIFEVTDALNIEGIDVVYKDDTFERYGHDRHVEHTKNSDNGIVIAAYINATIVGCDQPFSVVLNQQELLEIRQSYTQKLFKGFAAFSEAEWEAIFKTCVFERLLDEDVFSCVRKSLDQNATAVLLAVKNFHLKPFIDTNEEETKVYSSYGKLVAIKKHRFTALDKVQQKREKATKLTLAVSNPSVSHAANNVKSDEPIFDDVATEFGGF